MIILFRITLSALLLLVNENRQLTFETFKDFQEQVLFVHPSTMFILSFVEGTSDIVLQ